MFDINNITGSVESTGILKEELCKVVGDHRPSTQAVPAVLR